MSQAILLLGPTGSGKSPLGDLLEARGVGVHFDFGRRLRAANAGFSPREREVIAESLRTGALLENENFPIAARILEAAMGEAEWVILNGLPRHVGQARDVDALIDIRQLIVLEATPEVILERIARNTGGDRTGRRDDEEQAVRARLETYRARTLPLIDHYARRGARLIRLPVEVDSTADQLWSLYSVA
jgi:adenylate kinase family enzyme